MIYFSIFSGAFLGWGLGANDSANIFGTAVYTRIIKYSTAVTLTAIFVIAGAYINGHNGIENLSTYAYESGVNNVLSAFFVMLASAVTVTLMTFRRLPVSTSQAVIGAILGRGLFIGKADFQAGIKFFGAWFLTPIGAMIIAFLIYKFIGHAFEEKLNGFAFFEKFIKWGYIIAGIFASFSLGANNVANVTAVYSGKINLINPQQAVLIGGISIALGVITFSKPVMSTVGEKLVPLSPIAGFVVVIASGITVYIYALIGIPVSTSQAVVGAIIGIGLNMGVNTINIRMLKNIFFGWFGTPTVAAIISYLFNFIIML